MPIRRLEPTASATGFNLLIKSLLSAPLACAPDQEIVYRDRMRLTYRDWRTRLGRLASALTSLGVAPGDTVAVMDWDSHRYLECYFAVPMMGAVLQTVNIRLSPQQIAYTLAHAEASTILVHADFVPLLAGLLPGLPAVRRIVLLHDDAPSAPPFAVAGAYETLLAAADPGFDFPDFDEDAVATTFYTTGTTGEPKGVAFSHRQIVLHTLAAAVALASPAAGQRFHRGDVYMPLTPMFHVHAWGLPYVATMLGVKQVYAGRYEPATILGLRRREGVSFSHCVPTVLQMLLDAKDLAQERLDGWTMVIGGSALTLGLTRAATARGIDVFGGYGMSETCPIMTLAQPGTATDDAALAARTRTGRPVPLIDLAIVDESGVELPRDGRATGEIAVRAPWVAGGYVKQPDASAQLWRGGRLHTGDIAAIGSDGVVQISDRAKDVIKTGGEWVSSIAVEDAIGRLDGVAEVAVIGIADAKWGERPLALVVRRDPRLDAEAVKAHIAAFAARGALSRYAVPEQVRFVEALARTSVGKIDKKALRRQHAPEPA
ncbi:MAG: long-chain-fatty-acid--CoA ligase [Alphaproteobacteria bacterium]|nr:long-chain-fatty-acid--CoA ligase [Alphaproteobacteria bacterium]